MCQQALWPLHWRAANASVLIDWSAKYCKPKGRCNATVVLRQLVDMPAARVRAMQTEVAHAARHMFYRGELGDPQAPDAIDVLVEHLMAVTA